MPDTFYPDLIEAERRRLAEQLTSSIIAPLNLLLSQASAYEQTLGSNPQIAMVVAVLTSLARQIVQQALDLQANLHPTLLEVLGLDAALETLAQQQQRTSGILLTLKLNKPAERLSPILELALFRLIQDALTFANQHAKASQIDLTLLRSSQAIQLRIQDNGTRHIPRRLLTETVQRIQALGGDVTFAEGEVSVQIERPPQIELTTREREVLELLAEGLTNKEIAQRLDLSTRTVNFHLDNLYSKLGVNSRTEAVVYALRR